MSPDDSPTMDSSSPMTWVFGAATLLVGIVFFAGILLSSIPLLLTALGGALVVIVAAIAIDFHHTGIDTTENRVYAAGAIAGTAVLIGLLRWTALPTLLIYTVAVGVGVLLPRVAHHTSSLDRSI